MSTKYILRPTRVHVLPEGEELYSEMATVVEIEPTEGENILLRQDGLNTGIDRRSIVIASEAEWNAIAAAVADMFSEIAKHGTGGTEQ